MASKKLTADATLEDVLPTLSKPVDYVCGVLDHLFKCQKKHGNAHVAIGISGKGLKPYYRISFSTAEGDQVFDTFFDNHVSFAVEDLPTTGGTSWSSKSMTLEQIATLRGQLKS